MNPKVQRAPRESSQKSACPKRHHTIEQSKRLNIKNISIPGETRRRKSKVKFTIPPPCRNNTSKCTRSPRPIQQTYFLSRPLPHSSSPRLARRRSESIRQPREATSTPRTLLKKTLFRRSRFLKRHTPLAATMSALRAKVAYLQAWVGVSHTIEMHDLLLGPRRLMWVVVGDAEELVLICGTS